MGYIIGIAIAIVFLAVAYTITVGILGRLGGAVPLQQPQQQRVAAPRPAAAQPSRPVWKFFRPILGFALTIGLAAWIGFGVYKHFFTSSNNSGSVVSKPTPILLGTVDVPVDKWSEEIDAIGYGKVCFGRIDTSKGGVCEIMLDKDPKLVFPIKTSPNHVGLKSIQFKCSEAGARVEVSSSN